MLIRPITNEDRPWIESVFSSTNNQADSLGVLGFIAEERKDSQENPRSKENRRKVGLITYKVEAQECEIISLNSLTPGKGIGSMLLKKVEDKAKKIGCQKIVVKPDAFTKDFFLRKGFTASTADEIELQKTI